MSILERLNRLVRSNIRDLTGSSGGSSLQSALEEVENSLRDARRRRAEMRRNERQLVQSIRDARDEADEWEERAILALQKGDEDLAKEALKVKNDAIRRADELREDLREHRSHLEDIEASLEALETKLQSHRERLAGERTSRPDRENRAETWDRKLETRRTDSSDDHASDGATSPEDEVFRTGETFETFDRMAGKIDAMEAEIEAMRELSGDPGDSERARLERLFRKLEGQSNQESDSGSEPRDRERPEDRGRDNLSGMKQRIDRLSELKDKFGENGDDS